MKVVLASFSVLSSFVSDGNTFHGDTNRREKHMSEIFIIRQEIGVNLLENREEGRQSDLYGCVLLVIKL